MLGQNVPKHRRLFICESSELLGKGDEMARKNESLLPFGLLRGDTKIRVDQVSFCMILTEIDQIKVRFACMFVS